uniref:Uncharacterized protein n=1 Tax=Panagrolaimus sp. ES5 TaxID=591445 RepID=A0AC34FSR3_9BILA
MYSAIMIGAEVEVEPNEWIIIVLIDATGYLVTEFKYTVNGYLKNEKYRECEKDMKHEIIEQIILGKNNPAKIILHSNTPNFSSMKLLKQKVLKKYSKNLIILEEDWRNYDPKFVSEISHFLLDNSFTKYHILPTSHQNYVIGFECGGKKIPLILCKKDQIVPFKKTIRIPKTPLKLFLGFIDKNNFIVNHVFQFPREAHAYQLTLQIDANNFLLPDTKGVLSTKVPALTKLLNKKMDSKIPVIAFHFELSFIYIYDDEKGGYKLLDSWNGKLGKELFISFDEKKPKFFEKAAKKFQSTCNSVVHDIIQTMSKPLPKTYSVTSDSENPILFKYTNFDGSKKTATPAKIMSLLLKEHLKVIENESGEFPRAIAFSLLDDYDEDKGGSDEKNRIKKELKKSCDLINLECSFVDTNFASIF